MENKKMSLAALKAKANNVTSVEAVNAIKGGMDTVCHDGSCITPMPIGPVGTVNGGVRF